MKRLGLALVVAGLLGMLVAPAALATTTRFQISGTNTYTTEANGTGWQTANIFHDRGDTNTATVTGSFSGTSAGSFSGTSAAVINFQLNVVTGAGPMWGTAVIVLDDGGFNCTWNGAFAPGTYGSQYTFKELCHGYGTLTGWQARMDTTSFDPSLPLAPLGGFTFSGYAFMPGS